MKRFKSWVLTRLAASTLVGNEIMYIIQGGISKMVTLNSLSTFFGGGGGNKVYNGLLSQTNVFLTSGSLVIGNTYSIKIIKQGDDFTNVGYIDSQPFVATGTTPTDWSNGSRVFDISNSQPTVIIVGANTFGGISWSYNWDNDSQIGTSAGLFEANKTIYFITPTVLNTPIYMTNNNTSTMEVLASGISNVPIKIEVGV